jgi:hypothetical protein
MYSADCAWDISRMKLVIYKRNGVDDSTTILAESIMAASVQESTVSVCWSIHSWIQKVEAVTVQTCRN